MQWVARQQFHHRSALMQGWGAALLLVSVGLWIWLAFLLTDQADAYCYRVTMECKVISGWSEQIIVLALSGPLSVLGSALLVGGSVRRQTSAHVLQVIEMQESEERARNKR
ncbi:hypothetical protein ACFVXE_24495 [Streptomyces sp. NPDC058231]|uniref:hypothetical protein n=1 Tax=unclassified Streptomyces TaxID=2593676 RepID=UPI0036E5D8A5